MPLLHADAHRPVAAHRVARRGRCHLCDAMVRYRLSMYAVRSSATNVSQKPVVGEFENMLPLYS